MFTSLIGITDLVAVNLQCFGLIILGYFSRKFNLIGTAEERGLNIFVSYFSLPALIFQSLATLPLTTIDYNFVATIFLIKSLLYLSVFLITFLLSYHSAKLATIRKSAIFAIFCTQSNDFALGYPFLVSLYGSSSHSLANYLYILAPIQLLVLNPIALFVIEISKSLEQSVATRGIYLIFKIIVQKIFINPLIFATFFGLIFNLANGNVLPPVTVPLFQSLSQAFSSLALFLLGLNLYGNFKLLKNFSQPLLITLALVSIKIFLMPILNRTFVQHVRLFPINDVNSTLTEFSFLYGTFPSAPTVYILSNIYNIETVVISAGLVISTILSAPLMFVSANMIRLSSQIDYSLLNADLIDTIFATAIIGLTGLLFLVISFISGLKLRSLTHRCSLKILMSHFVILLGGLLFKLNSTKQPHNKLSLIQYLFFNIGQFSFKLWICFLSLTLVLLYAKSLCFVIKISNRFFYISLALIGLYIGFLVSGTLHFEPSQRPLIDLYFGFNRIHLAFSIFMSVLTITVSIVSFVLFYRYKNKSGGNYERISEPESPIDSLTPSNSELSQPSTSSEEPAERLLPTVVDVEDLFSVLPRKKANEDFKQTCNNDCHSQCVIRKDCSDRLQKYIHEIEEAIDAVEALPFTSHTETDDFHQIYHHMYLILFSILSITVNVSVELFHLFNDEPSGIYVEIEFLDILLTFSQGFIMFIIFGLDIDAIIYKLSRVLKITSPVLA